MRYRVIVGIGLLIVLFLIIASCFSKTETISLEDQNMDIVLLADFAYMEGDWASFADLHSPDFILHRSDGEDPVNWTEFELQARVVRNRLPDLQFRNLDMFACKDKVAVRSIWEYRNNSRDFKLFYPDGVAQGSAIGITRIENGKIIESWGECDPAPIKKFYGIYKSINPKK